MLTLSSAGWMLTLLPALGGAIGALRYRDVDVLRPTAPGTADPLHSACFPLVPYANRIAGGRFFFAGRKIVLPLNFGDHPNSLHGLGWQREWGVVESSPERALLAHTHDGGEGWPWAYHAEQLFEIGAAGLRVTLALTNRSKEPMPAGLGFHPYFPISRESRLRFRAQRVWLAESTQIPTRAVAADHFGDWASGAPLSDAGFVDNSYEQWDGQAALDQDGRRVRLSARGARDLHLYIPAGESFCCLEPVTHLPDAINRPGAVFDTLGPGVSMTLAMRIAVDRG